jgi:integrase
MRRDEQNVSRKPAFSSLTTPAIALHIRRSAFRKLTLQLGWLADGKRPRLHDLRHTFACRVLLKWRCRRTAQEDRIDWLSRYLGHERVSDTYWYLSATPQLFAATARQFKHPPQQ